VFLPDLGALECLRVQELRRIDTTIQTAIPLTDTAHLRSYTWIAKDSDVVARVTSELHSSLLGPFGLPPEDFSRASLVEIMMSRSRAKAVSWRRGEVNVDGAIDLSDAALILGYLFRGDDVGSCPAAADLNSDLEVDVSDPIFLLLYLFA